jgi:putative DNA primase/helicase
MVRKATDPVNFTRYRLGQALKYGTNKRPLNCLFNVVAVLEQDDDWKAVLGWNAMSSQVIKRKPPPFPGGEPGPWSDVDEIRTAVWIADRYDFNPHVKDVRLAMLSSAHRAAFHPVCDYLATLKWDGTPRVSDWACVYLGADSSGDAGAYALAAGRKWLLSAVARAMHHQTGCKADNVLILEGPQGRLKSSALRVLAGDWFLDTPFNLHDRDRFTHIQGRWIIELAELDGFSRAESSAAKAFFSSSFDVYTPKYIAHAIEVKRQCVFAGTVNLGQYLHDRTGNRRYWPLRVGQINLEALQRDRDQLWAEALALFAAGEKWWVEPHEVSMFAAEQHTREMPDALEDVVAKFIEDKADGVTMRQILELGLDMAMKDWTPALQARIGHIMSALGWDVQRQRVAGTRERVYRRRVEA